VKSITVSTVGYGYIGKVHTIAYQSLPLCYNDYQYDVRLKTLVTHQRIEKGFSFPYQNITDDIENLGETDIADICTPNFAHFDEIVKLDNQGVKNIYCEKPLAGFFEDEKKLVELAENHHINNQVALVFRFLPSVIRGRKLVSEGIIGDIIHFNCRYYHDGYLDTNKPFTWRLEREKSGGGALIDLGIHAIDMVRYVLGGVKEVRGYAKTVIKKRPLGEIMKDVDVDDFAHLDLMLDNNAQGTVEVSRVSTGASNELVLEIFGNRGSLIISADQPDNPQITIFGRGRQDGNTAYEFSDVQADIKYLWPGSKNSLGLLTTAHLASINCFISAVGGRKFEYIKAPTFADSFESIKVIERIYGKHINNDQ
jgi:predicted dehydrogenase